MLFSESSRLHGLLKVRMQLNLFYKPSLRSRCLLHSGQQATGRCKA